MVERKGWKVYVCAVETALVEEAEGARYRLMEYSTPIECQPTTMSNVFVRRRDADVVVRELNSQKNGLLYYLKAGRVVSRPRRFYRAEARRV